MKAKSLVHEQKPRFGKDDRRYWRNKVKKRTYKTGDGQLPVAHWQVRLTANGKEHWFNLGTENRDLAAAKAREIYLHLKANGVEQTTEVYKPKPVANKAVLTIGEYIDAVAKTGCVRPTTFTTYSVKVRRIIAAILGIPRTNNKYDYKCGGLKGWREKVDAYPLKDVTLEKINAWKMAFVATAGDDPLKRKRAEHTVNSCLRNARAMFGRKVISQLAHLELPEKLPFQNLIFFRQGAFRYRSKVDIPALVAKANETLAKDYPIVYAIFVLALFAGLRRGEIDGLMWNAIDWERRVIKIRPTIYNDLKTDSSVGDVPVEKEVIDLLAQIRNTYGGEFVIPSANDPKINRGSHIYRANPHFCYLISWLRSQGIDARSPLHTLRKEYGRLITEKFGIFAASKLLRHSSIQVTASFYADDTRHLTLEMGGMLKA